MRRPITDTDMLRAAERALAEHLEQRPATAAEAQAIADSHRSRAAQYRADIAKSRRVGVPTISELIGRGERGAHVVELNHALGRIENRRVKDCMEWERLASAEDMRADAWQRVADAGEGEVYRQTLAELQARVDYYAARCAV